MFDEDDIKNQYVVIQGSTMDDIIALLKNKDDKKNIVQKKHCFELIIQWKQIKEEEIDHLKRTKLVVQRYYYNLSTVNDKALHLLAPCDAAFDIVSYMFKEKGRTSYHIKHAIEQFMILTYEASYQESIKDFFWGSKLHQTMIKQLVFEYYEMQYYHEDDFRENGSLRLMVTLLGEWIGSHRLQHFVTLHYETAKMMFFQPL
jgi:hypothetical protein